MNYFERGKKKMVRVKYSAWSMKFGDLLFLGNL